MYLKHLDIQQGGGSVEAQQLRGRDVGASATEPGASASVPRPPLHPPPFQQGGGSVEAQQLGGRRVETSATDPGASAMVPCPPHQRPPLLPPVTPVTNQMAEVVGLLKTVLTELTVVKEEIKKVASDIQQLKDQVRVLTVAANDMVQR